MCPNIHLLLLLLWLLSDHQQKNHLVLSDSLVCIDRIGIGCTFSPSGSSFWSFGYQKSKTS